MNRIYRSIWNQATGAYSAVSENVKSAGKRSMPGSAGGGAHFALTSMAAALMLGYGSLALAGPTGGTVVAGQANISGAPGSTVINQGSQNAVINWANFNINKGESVQFVQPNSNAVALNRVLGNDGTTILGNLSANGKVFIVNPNGILFGQGASVNTAGLVASTLDINNADFMAGNYKFAGNGSGRVLNQGSISAPGGYVALLGANVSNEGTINARLGSVALAAGNAITLDVAGDGLLNVAVDRGAVGALVQNGGLIQADGGSVLLTAQAAGNLLKTVVNNTGVIEAHTIDTRSGTIKLLGDMQSGTVNAAGTLDASASAGGNGGFVDTSAAYVNIADGIKVTAKAANGLSGTWLIDPVDFNIAATGGNLSGATLTASLAAADVQIRSTNGSGGTAGDINVNDMVSWSANKLTLTAQNNININQPLRGSGTASLALEYGQANVALNNKSAYNVKAEIDLPSGSNFSTKLGNNGTVVPYTVINSLGAANSTSGTDLQGLQNALPGNFVLGANIDASVTSNTTVWGANGFAPIGTTGTSFSGQFDGLGHVINGLRIGNTTAGAGVGLFGVISSSAQVRNIGIVAPTITSNVVSGAFGNVGALVGYNNGGTINNAYVSGGTLTSPGLVALGGLVGQNSGTISNSYNSAALLVTTNSGSSLGGLVGQTIAGSNISNSYNTGTVTANNNFAGGLVGSNLGSISDSFNTGAVTAGVGAGGITANNGSATDPGLITNSYNTGTIVGIGQVGGVVGYNFLKGEVNNSYSTGSVTAGAATGTDRAYGGLVGDNRGIVANSYATGSVTGTGVVGGVVGASPASGTITNVYSSGVVSLISGGTGTPGGVVGTLGGTSSINGGYFNNTVNFSLSPIGILSSTKPTPAANVSGLGATAMRTASKFVGFDFTTTTGATGNNWVMVNTDGTLNNANSALGATGPMLSSEYSTTIKSPHQLQLMAMNLAGNYTLGRDLDATATGTADDVWNGATFVPVGASTAAPFTGTFDGAGHVISNLALNRPSFDNTGLFGATSSTAVIRNVGLQDGNVNGARDTASLVGNNAGAVSGSYSTMSVTGTANTGGLVGNNSGTVSNSYASGAVSGTNTVGGLVGVNSGALTNNYATGAVTGSSNTGGLAGASTGSATGNFWDTVTSGMNTSAAGTGLATTAMKSLTTYTAAAWDQANTWIIYDTNTYPLLRAFMTPLQVNFAANNSKTYDGTSTFTASGVTANRPGAYASLLGTLSAGTAGNAINAGTYAITAGGLYSGQRGYIISYGAGNVTIDKKAVTVSGMTASAKTYDGNATASLTGGTLSGLVVGETVSFSGQAGAFADQNAGAGKSVSVSGITLVDGANLASNYSVTNPTGLTADITPKALTVTGATAGNKVYDGNTKATVSGGTLDGLVTGETLSVSGQTGTFSDKNAGTGKVVTVTGTTLVDGSGLASNYSLANPTGVTGDITKKALTITGITATNRAYTGGTAVSLGGTVILDGLVGAEGVGVGGMVGVFADKNVGTGKAVTITGAVMTVGSNGGLASNYTISNPTGVTANITKATISAVTNIVIDSKVYDGGLNAIVNAAGATFGGIKSGDSLTVNATTATFADKNVGTGKTVNISGIGLGGTDAGNYNLTTTTGSSTGAITPKALTIIGMSAVSKVYDGNTKASVTGGSIDGLVGLETLGVTGLTVTFDDKNAGTGKAVTATGTTLVNGGNGGLAANYTMANPTGFTANITPKALTVSGMTAGSKVYDGNTSATLLGGSLSGVVSGETLVLSGGSGVFVDKNAGNGKAVTVSGVGLLDGTGLASNYSVTNPTNVTGSITQKALTVSGTLLASDKTYDGNTTASISGGTLSGFVGTETVDLSGLSGTFSDKNAGSGKTVTVSGGALANGNDGGLASNYSVSVGGSMTASITQKALSVTGVAAANKVYDSTTKATVTGGALNGLVGSETLGLSGLSGVFGDKNAGAGKVVTVSGVTLADGTGLASNYTVSNPTTVTANINQATINTVSNIVADSKVYDANTKATVTNAGATFAGLFNGDALSVSATSATFADKNAGSGKTVTASGLTLGGTDAGNYNLTAVSGTGTGTITPKALTIVGMSAVNKTYDGSTKASVTGGSISGLVGSETLGVTGLSVTFDNRNAGTGKAVTATGTTLVNGGNGGLAANYTMANPTGFTANITPKALTVSGMTAGTRVYDGSTTATLSGGALSGLVSGETLVVSGGSGVFGDKNVGTAKAVTVSGVGLLDGTGLASNYTVTNPTTVTGSITQKALAITGMTAADKTYDGTTKATLTGGALSGLVGSETLGVTGLSASFDDKNAGAAKTVTATGSTLVNGGNGGLASNYSITNPTGLVATIAQKALTITGMTAVNKVYDGNTKASVTGGSISGLVGSETLGVTGLSVTFDNKNAGTGKAVTATGTTLVNGGNGGLATNYTMANPTGFTANITPKALTVSGMTAGTKVYDGTTAATLLGGSLSGVVSGETLVLSGGSGVFVDKNAGNGKAVTVSGVGLLDGTGLASNYSVTNPTNVTGSITQKALTVSGTLLASDKTYDGNTTASISGGTLSGFVGTETVDLSGLSGTFSDKNAGSGKTVTVSGGALANGNNGGLGSNYSVSVGDSMTASITQKALSVTGVAAANKVYDSTTKATVTGGALNGLVGSETLGLSGLSGVFGDKNAGAGKVVTVSGVTLADGTGLASNYTISSPTTVTANINQATINTVSNIVADSKVYDANTKATVTNAGATFAGLFNGDALSVSATSATFADKNAGSGKTVTASGLTLGGTDAGNYNLTAVSGSGTGAITPKALTIVGMSAVNKVYDGSTKASVTGGSISGLVGSETLGVTGLSVTFDNKNAGTGKAVTATGTTLVNGGNGGLATNYTMANPTGFTANITPKALTVSGMTAGTRAYDGSTTATLSGGALSGLANGETLVVSGGSGVFGDKNVGTAKAVTVSGVGLLDGTGLASNYMVANPTTVTGSITQKALAITGMTAADKTYDGTTKATLTGGALSGLVGSETLGVTGLSASFDDKNAGAAKTVTATGSTLVNGGNGGLASNYSITNPTGLVATIAQKALTITGMTAVNKVYDGNTKASVTGGSISGLVGSETLGVTGLSASFDDKNAGIAKTVKATGSTLVNGGNGGLAANYTLSNPTGLVANITPKALTISGMSASGKVYDGTTDAVLSGGTLQGLVTGETIAITGKTGVFTNQNAGLDKDVRVQTLELTNGTGLASNYSVSMPMDMKADITQKLLTVTAAVAADKTYDGARDATITGGTLDGFVGLETVSLTGLSGAFGDQNAGNNKAVSITGGTLANGNNGGLGSNYTVAGSMTASIAQKALSVTGVTAGNKDYDATTKASISGGALDGLVGSETLGLSGLSAAFGDKNAGTDKAVIVSGATLADGSNGGLASNYKVSDPIGVKADIAKANITGVTGFAAGTKVYEATTMATVGNAGATFAGMFDGDALNVSASSANFIDKNAGSGKAVNASGLTLGGADAGNYNLKAVTGTGTGTITQAQITGVTGIIAGSKTYDATATATVSNAGATFAGMLNGDALIVSATSATFNDKNAGSGKTVNANGLALGGADAGNYNLTAVTGTGTGTITQAQIASVSGITAAGKTYDGSDAATLNTSATYNGRFGGDSLSFTATKAAFSDKNAANGKAVNVEGIVLGGADAGNYILASNIGIGTGDIAKAIITGVSGIAAGDKVYDGTRGATLDTSAAGFTGMIAGDKLSVTGAGLFDDKNVATGKTVNIESIALAGADAGNYTLSTNTASTRASIGQATITGVAGITAGDKVYDGTRGATLDTSGATFAGMVAGDQLNASGAGLFADKNAATGKTVTISGIALGGADAGNYSLSTGTASTRASISQATITGVTGIVAGSKVYDTSTKATVSNAGATFAGMVNGDALNVSAASATFNDKNAGSGKAVNASGLTLGGTDAGNYNLTALVGSGTGTITQAQISSLGGITAVTKTYDGTDTASLNAGATYNGVLGGDSLTFTATRAAFSDKNAATSKTVNVSGIALGGTDAGNYSLASNSASGTGAITPKALTVTGATVVNKVYDGTLAASVTGGALSGLVGGETLSLSGLTATFASQNAASNIAVTASGATLANGAGLASNYTVSNPTGLQANITPKELSIGGITAGNKIYDGTFDASLSGGALQGLVVGETLVLSATIGKFADKNVGNGKAVTVSGASLADGTGLASNYTVASPSDVTASITAKALTVTGQLAGNKVYDGNAQASLSGGALSGLVGVETLGFGGQTAVFSDKNAANGKTVTVTGTTLVDTASGLASNYTVSNPTGLTGSITAKALTVTGQLAGNKVYDGNTVASLAGGALSGLVGGETLNLAGQTAVFSDKNAATVKGVTVTGTTLVDTANGLASNYTVSNPTGLTASITARALTVTGQLAGNKVYDGNTAAQLSGGALSGLVAGETLVIGGQSAVFADKNAGTAKTVTVTGTTLVDTASGLARNYTVSNPTGLTASITPASLLVRATGAASRVYDTTSNASVTLSDNRIAGDVLSISNSGARFADKNAGTNKTVTVNGIALGGTDAGNYTVNATATTTASITQAALGVKVDNAEKDQGRVNPAFTASYTGLIGSDTLANEVSGNLAFSTPATTGSPSGSYLVSAAGQTSTNYALTYTPGVLTVNPTEALQSAVASVIAAVNVAPSQGNMVQAEVVSTGEKLASKVEAVAVAQGEPEQGTSSGTDTSVVNTPAVQLAGTVTTNVLPGLRLSVVDTGLRLPVEGGNTSVESE